MSSWRLVERISEFSVSTLDIVSEESDESYGTLGDMASER